MDIPESLRGIGTRKDVSGYGTMVVQMSDSRSDAAESRSYDGVLHGRDDFALPL